MITIQVVQSHADIRRFIQLPYNLYRDNPDWVPPFLSDEKKFHQPETNHLLRLCLHICFLAVRNGTDVGRVMGIIHVPHNKAHQEKTARFFKLDAVDDGEVVAMLLNAVEDWARNQQMNTLVGPFGFSDKDPQGMQVEGREYVPVIAAPSHPGYLVSHLVKLGFQPHIDCLSYGLPVQALPDPITRIAERARTLSGAHLVQFRSRRELKPWIVPVLRLVNETYADLFGFMPMEEDEMQALARQYLPVLDPEFTLVMTDDSGAVVAFGIAMPNITPGIRKARGHLFPFGIIHLLLASRKSRQLDLLLGAVRSNWRNRGLTAWLGQALMQSAMNRKLEWIDSHLILEKNRLMRGVMEKFGGTVYKRYRIFYRPIKESAMN